MSDLKQILLIGAPNCGKTTLFNWLTRSHSKTVNYAGSTVEIQKGPLVTDSGPDNSILIVDTPGIYSFPAMSEDQKVTEDLLKNGSKNHCLVVIDGTQFKRGIELLETFKKSEISFTLIITMSDLLKKKQIQINLDQIKTRYHCPVLMFDGQLGQGLNEIIHILKEAAAFETKSLIPLTEPERRESRNLSHDLIIQTRSPKNIASLNQYDSFLLHPIWGYFSFAAVMTLFFSSLFWLATPFMDLIDEAAGLIIEKIISLSPDSLFADFIAHGVIASFSSVAVFAPQILLLFFGLGILESSGYLARASALIDRPLALIGLSGRSFVPLLSGYACAIPAMMAARTMSNRKEKWIVLSIIPLMSCSARLPVYSLFLVFLMPEAGALTLGLTFFFIYFISALIGALASGVLSRFLKNSRSHLMIELPAYRKPLFRKVLLQGLRQTKSYFTKAGPVIFILSLCLWFGSNFPRENFSTAATPVIADSYLGSFGQLIDPVFAPMGLDWRVGIGLISSFAAREVFVSTLALVFGVTGSEEGLQHSLIETLKTTQHLETGSPLFSTGSVLALMFFFLVALQCMSTFAVSKKESGSWKFAIIQLVVLNFIAYLGATLIYQISSLI